MLEAPAEGEDCFPEGTVADDFRSIFDDCSGFVCIVLIRHEIFAVEDTGLHCCVREE